MIPEIGHFALVIALLLALVQSLPPLIGAHRGDERWMTLARPAAHGQSLFLLFSFLCLVYCFVTNDFTVRYVASNSNSYLPWYYKVSAVWGGHEGSLLLWVLVLGVWSTAVAWFSRSLPLEIVSRVLGVMGLISMGFLLFMLITSNPFERLLPDFPLDGRDLNPLLQDIGLIIHPPMLYMGYVGFSVAFAFAIAGLLQGRLDSAWARWSRPWTTVAWCFLTLGIALGSWWAYYELGWGGWWFWDPVENASFMPWLAGTALMHSLAVTEKRGVFKAWTVLLAILAFSLSLLGTFLVRSGVLTSVHAFASDPSRGVFILGFLAVVVGGSLSLFAWKGQALTSESRYQLFSREVMMLANNVILVIATLVVLLGTLYPLLADVLELGKISVGPPYFNTVFVPLALLIMVFMGIGSISHWKRQDPKAFFYPLKTVMILALLGGLALPLLLAGDYEVSVAVTLVLVLWVVGIAVRDIASKARNHRSGVWAGLRALPRSYKGMWIAHLGLLVSVIGVAMTSMYAVERDVRLAPGDRVQVGPYHFVFKGTDSHDGPNYTSTKGTMVAYKGNREISTMHPEKRRYWVQNNVMTEAAIDAGFSRDLYVALGEKLGDDAWAVRVYFKPFVRWIWGGAVLMAWGGALAIADRRYRLAKRARVEPVYGPETEAV